MHAGIGRWGACFVPLSMAEFLSRLDGVIQQRDGWKALCPAHDDHRQSLTVKAGHRQPIVTFCHAGCKRDAVLTAMHLTLADICADRPNSGNGPRAVRRPPSVAPAIVATYDYRDVAGVLQYQIVRYAPKDFRPRRPDPQRPGEWIKDMEGVERVPYRLDEIALFCSLGTTTVVITEGEKDADALWDLSIPATTNAFGAQYWSAAFSRMLKQVGVREVLVAQDNDDAGRERTAKVITLCRNAGLVSRLLLLDGLDEKGADVSDFLQRHDGDEFRAAMVRSQTFTPITDVHEVFQTWLGLEYDLKVLDVLLAATAAHWLDGEPCWLMIVAGSGAAKTETVQAIEGAGGVLISTLSSTAALLSGSPRRDRAADATGGLLPSLGDNGVLIIKDMTSILSLPSASRGDLLAAIRELHDGRWSRQVGTEGGRRLEWSGRLTIVAACTSAWDRAHEAIAAMGDRFLLVRFDSRYGREAAFLQAHKNNGREAQMRRELSRAVGRALASVEREKIEALDPDDIQMLFRLANLVTLVRTAVDTDYRDDVRTAYAPEMPTRFGKQLGQLVRGGMALGLPREEALELAIRVAEDSMPPLRWRVLHHVSTHPGIRASDIRKTLDTPYNTVKRTLDALLVLGVINADGEDQEITYTVKSEVVPGILAVSRNGGREVPDW
jgi:5S rRNA maturation endonuclease (ribonuclease M5)